MNDKDLDNVVMGLYAVLVNRFHWSLNEIDNANLETLMDFIYHKDNDYNTRAIKGKTFRRARGVATWL